MSPSAANVSIRLSVMMFLQFFIWGAWYVTPYLWLGKIGFLSSDIGWTYSVGPIAGMISPFFLGMIADRFFATERVLGVMHLIGAGFMYWAATVMKEAYPDPMVVNLLFFGHMLCYYPTLALTNTLALHNMTNAERQFPLIRVFGTIGWIVAGQFISWRGWDAALQMFNVATVAAVVMGVYCFTLPHTPPPSKGKEFSAKEAFGLDALVLLKQPSYFFFMLCSFLICIPLAFYYALTGRFVEQMGFEKVSATISMGQMSEVFFMILMPLFFARLGVKKMLLVGMFAWAVRYGLFAFAFDGDAKWMVLGGILLHGICYDFFFVTGQIYTDRVAPPAIRGQAQGMLVLFTLGLGMFIGAKICGEVEAHYTSDEAKAFQEQAAVKGQEFLALKEEYRRIAADDPDGAAAFEASRMTPLAEEIGGLQGQAFALAPSWKEIWLIPAIASGAVLLFFAVVFRDPGKREEDEDGDVPLAPGGNEALAT